MKQFMRLFDPERWDKVRSPNQKELNVTALLKIPMVEAVVKIRTGPPVDKKEDQDRNVWAGTIPYSPTKQPK